MSHNYSLCQDANVVQAHGMVFLNPRQAWRCGAVAPVPHVLWVTIGKHVNECIMGGIEQARCLQRRLKGNIENN